MAATRHCIMRPSAQVDKKLPNVLRVTVIRAKDCPPSTRSCSGRGRPRPTHFQGLLRVIKIKGSVKKKCLAPVWLERFELPCEDPDSVSVSRSWTTTIFGAAV